MSLKGKKIWIDIEEPKTGIMFNSLFKMFEDEGINLLITARDYDSTFQILDDLGVEYQKIGKHGGDQLSDKLETYINRLKDLLPPVKKFDPDYFVTFSSVEGTRIAYGLQIPSMGYNDEPRNEPVCKQILPFLDNVIVPFCVPKEWYINLGADPKKLLRYNGIDEIAWLSEYSPNPGVLNKFEVEKGKYIIMRSEPSFASYLIDKVEPEATLIDQIFPPIYEQFPDNKYFLLVRTEKQEKYLKDKLKKFSGNKNIIITRYLSDIADLCFYGALIISGGGTIVRESSLLSVPSIEFFPGETAPQEHFLVENEFPIEHIKEPKDIINSALDILSKGPSKDRFNMSFKDKIKQFENPNQICFKNVTDNLLKNK